MYPITWYHLNMISRDMGTRVSIFILGHQSRYLHNHNDTDKTNSDSNAFDNLI